MNKFRRLIFITFCFILFFVIKATAQPDSIAVYEKALANAKDDTVKQYYHCKLYWACYLQPKKLVYHIIEAGIYQGNVWSFKEDVGDYEIIWDSAVTIRKELKAAKEKFKANGDKFREARALIALSVFEDNAIQQTTYLQEALAIVQQQKDSKLKRIYLEYYLNIDLLQDFKQSSDPHLGINETLKLQKEFIRKNNLFNSNSVNFILAIHYHKLNIPDSARYFAEEYFKYELQIGDRIENTLPMATQLLMNNWQLKNYDLCKYYAKYIEARIDSVSRYKSLTCYLTLSMAFYYMHKEISGSEYSIEKSKEYLNKSKVYMDSYTALGRVKLELQQLYYSYYADWAKLSGDYKTAYQQLQTFFTIYDSSMSANNVKAFNEMQIQYDVAQKEKDLQLAAEKTRLQTTWFIVIVLAILAIAFGIFYYQRNRNKINQLEELLKVRNTIAANLHDEVGSTLGSVAIMSRMAQSKDLDEKDVMLHTISNNSQTMLDSMRDIVWSINPENDTLEKMLSRMRLFAAETLEKQDISVVFNSNIKHIDSTVPIEKRKDIYLIYKEAIVNAAKYSKADNVEINIAGDNKMLTLSIKDNGVGFDSTNTESLGGNGLKNMQKRADNIGGTMEIKSTLNNGTSVVLRVNL